MIPTDNFLILGCNDLGGIGWAWNKLKKYIEGIRRSSWSSAGPGAPSTSIPGRKRSPKMAKFAKNCKHCKIIAKIAKNAYICTDLQNFEKILQTNTKYWKNGVGLEVMASAYGAKGPGLKTLWSQIPIFRKRMNYISIIKNPLYEVISTISQLARKWSTRQQKVVNSPGSGQLGSRKQITCQQ